VLPRGHRPVEGRTAFLAVTRLLVDVERAARRTVPIRGLLRRPDGDAPAAAAPIDLRRSGDLVRLPTSVAPRVRHRPLLRRTGVERILEGRPPRAPASSSILLAPPASSPSRRFPAKAAPPGRR